MSRRVYLGHLPPNVSKTDIEDHFKGYGKIVDIRPMGNFGFLEFESSRDAEDVVRDFNGRPFMGENLIVEPSRDTRRKDFYDPNSGDRGPPRSSAPRKGVRVTVIGIPSSTSWQDLKDYGRIGNNNIIYADVDRNNPSNGIIEYTTMADAEEALSRLAGVDINGTPVTLELAQPGGGGDFDRRPPPPRDYDRPRYDGRSRDDRPRDDRPRYDDRRTDRYERRDRSPPRRQDDRTYDREPRRDYGRDRSPPRRQEDDRAYDRDKNGH
ncbi:hypothetical protein BCR39DRAFT_488186 [Naematelia encephala]|uniref:RRM domain-containing protein n=1 Tax=Naematelia encephala TaxID=71784 RepID=A0A1Y2AHH5_9TREE|nr:hypothetical protein BCR39DRAFT_488186 [Naematelia encephala]